MILISNKILNMITKFTLFILLIISQTYFSQTHRFFYRANFKKDSLQTEFTKQFFVLDINKNNSKFYSTDYLTNDSINKINKDGDYEFSYPKLDFRIIKKGKVFENYVSQSPNFYCYETTDKQDWTILPEKKKIKGFDAQKATTQFGGREWVAWFTNEIQFSSGPYKFHGLPGLILEIHDSKNNYNFEFIGNKNLKEDYDTSLFIESTNKEKPMKISEKSWAKLNLDYFVNPLKDYGDSKLLFKDEQGNMKEVDPREFTQQGQTYLRKYNNPIEIDKAIRYPNK